jgi:hypothetical protein
MFGHFFERATITFLGKAFAVGAYSGDRDR